MVDMQNEQHSSLYKRTYKQRGDFRMRTQKYYLHLADDEYRLIQ